MTFTNFPKIKVVAMIAFVVVSSMTFIPMPTKAQVSGQLNAVVPTTAPPSNQAPGSVDIPAITNPTGADNLSVFIYRIIRVLLTLIAMAAVIMIVVSGFKMVAYGGNPSELGKAKAGLIWAILGLVIAIMSFSIISFIQKLF